MLTRKTARTVLVVVHDAESPADNPTLFSTSPVRRDVSKCVCEESAKDCWPRVRAWRQSCETCCFDTPKTLKVKFNLVSTCSMEKISPKSSEFSHWPSGSEMFDDFLKSSQGCLHHPSAQASLHSRTLPQLNQKSCNDAVDNSCSTLSRSVGLGWWETNLPINSENCFQTLLEREIGIVASATCQNISNISRSSAVLAHGPRGLFNPHFLQHRLSRTCPFSSSWCRCRHFSTPNTAPNLRWPMFGSFLSICNSDLEDLTTWRRSLDNPLLISFKSTFRLAKSRLQFVQGLNSVVLLFMYTWYRTTKGAPSAVVWRGECWWWIVGKRMAKSASWPFLKALCVP